MPNQKINLDTGAFWLTPIDQLRVASTPYAGMTTRPEVGDPLLHQTYNSTSSLAPLRRSSVNQLDVGHKETAKHMSSHHLSNSGTLIGDKLADSFGSFAPAKVSINANALKELVTMFPQHRLVSGTIDQLTTAMANASGIPESFWEGELAVESGVRKGSSRSFDTDQRGGYGHLYVGPFQIGSAYWADARRYAEKIGIRLPHLRQTATLGEQASAVVLVTVLQHVRLLGPTLKNDREAAFILYLAHNQGPGGALKIRKGSVPAAVRFQAPSLRIAVNRYMQHNGVA